MPHLIDLRRCLPALLLALSLLAVPATSAGAVSSATVQGVYEVSHGDDLVNYVARYQYRLALPDGSEVELHFAGRPPAVSAGSVIRVTGERTGAVLEVSSVAGSVRLVSAPGPDNTIFTPGAKKELVILFNFQNNTATPFTTAQVRSAFFTGSPSSNTFFQENSFGSTSLVGKLSTTGDIYGWYTIPVNLGSTCDTTTWETDARQAATTAGVNLTGYDSIIYIFPNTAACSYGGQAWWSWSSDGTTTTVNKKIYINGTLDLATLSHELGHTFGEGHADSYRCVNGSGQAVAISANCTIGEYGDPFDVMGNGGLVQMSGFHKGESEWLAGGNTQTVTTSGTYTLAPTETSTTGTQTLRILWGTDSVTNPSRPATRYYYLEYRRPTGFDAAFGSSSAVVNGVTIRLATDYSYTDTYGTWPYSYQSWLIDTTPSTSSFSDAPLAAGQTFTDPTLNLCVKTVSLTSTLATVQIGLSGAGCSGGGGGAGTVAVSPTSGTYKARVTATSTDWTPNTAISLYWDSTATLLASGTTDGSGSFTSAFTVPAATFGSHTVMAVQGGNSASTPFSIKPKVVLSVLKGAQGSTSKVTGYGFPSGASVTFHWGSVTGPQLGTTVAASSQGTTPADSFTVPTAVPGKYTVVARDTASHTASTVYTLIPGVSISPISGPHGAGATATVTLSNFAAGSTVTLKWSCTTYGCVSPVASLATVTAPSTGTFTVPIAIPATNAVVGTTYTIGAIGSTSTAYFGTTRYKVTS